MGLLLDLLYLVAVLISAPVWLFRMARTGKLRTDWAARFGRARPRPRSAKSRILIHAVSVGEVNAVRHLVRRLAEADPPHEVILATTTDTGFARARQVFGADHDVVRYPFDFTFSVRRFLRAVDPDVVVLAELEVWPTFTRTCAARDIPICVVNGRLSARSFSRYRRLRPFVAPMFRRLRFVAAQNDAYARRFRDLGIDGPRVLVTGTMKWDTAEIATAVPGSDELVAAMGIDRSRPLVVAGSTAPDEHALLHQAVPEGAQLLCAPRRPEWFDDAAAALPGAARRARGDRGSTTGRFLLDTIGELRQAYALADLVVVGRTFGTLHGSDMMEPVALGKATIVGPAVSDFQETVDALLAGGGLMQVSASELAATIADLLPDAARRAELAARGIAVIRAHQGATERHAELICSLLEGSAGAEPCRVPELSWETSPNSR